MFSLDKRLLSAGLTRCSPLTFATEYFSSIFGSSKAETRFFTVIICKSRLIKDFVKNWSARKNCYLIIMKSV